MVDRERRDQFAELLRHFIAGRLTNDEYEARVDAMFGRVKQQDMVLHAVYERAWFLYDGLRAHRMTGKWALPPETRHEVARWIMFLYTDQEYEWSVSAFISISSCLLNLITFGLWGWIMAPYYTRRVDAMGNWDVWPFVDIDRQTEARQNPRLFRKAKPA